MDAATASTSHDPYYVVQGELQSKVSGIEGRAQQFVQLLETTDTSSNAEFRELRKALTREVKAADAQLKDLKLTVDYVERDRATFAHIDDSELESRRQFIRQAKGAIDGFKATLTGDNTKRKLMADEKKAMEASMGDTTLGAKTQREMNNTSYIHDQQVRTQMTMREQDESVEELDGAVTRISHMALEINSELKDQQVMLGEVERDMDETSEKMNFAMQKLQKLLKTNDSCQIWTIVILVIILAVLVVMVIYV